MTARTAIRRPAGAWALSVVCGLAAAVLPAVAAAQVFVSAAELRRELGHADAVVLHPAMDQTEYAAGHVPGARFAPVMSFHGHGESLPEPAQIAAALGRLGVTNRSRVFIVGTPMSAALLYVALDYVGHAAQTRVLDGGLAAWRAGGGEVSTDAPAVEPATFTPAPLADLVVTASWVEAHRARPGFALLDARSAAEYAGTTDRERLPRAGHIPGAGNLDWLDTFDPRDRPRDREGRLADNAPPDARMAGREELRRRFDAAGVAASDTVVTYCTVGMRASHLYLVARHLGHPARLYVGSMRDWSPREELPVARGSAP